MNGVLTEDQKKELQALVAEERIFFEESMANHTTFRAGGPAEVFVTPGMEELKAVVMYCREQGLPLTVLGNGSNVLVSDEGLPGVTVRLGKELGTVLVREEAQIYAEAGALLSTIAQAAAANSLAGMEFASGIPGSFGGAILMNAGAYGGEMKDILMEATVLTKDGEYKTYPVEELELSYRHSRFIAQTEDSVVQPESSHAGGASGNGGEQAGASSQEIIVSGRLRLTWGEETRIRETMRELNRRRVEKQPLEYPSAGSTFKRPEGYFAGKLIEDSGLRGFTMGHAAVSEKHCGFVINKGGATAVEIRTLIEEVRRIVLEKQGVELTPEVRFLGWR